MVLADRSISSGMTVLSNIVNRIAVSCCSYGCPFNSYICKENMPVATDHMSCNVGV
jgi:hypothetical protein